MIPPRPAQLPCDKMSRAWTWKWRSRQMRRWCQLPPKVDVFLFIYMVIVITRSLREVDRIKRFVCMGTLHVSSMDVVASTVVTLYRTG